MRKFWQDLRYGAPNACQKPRLHAVAILTLALGIGANSAIFSVINAVLLKPLPYPEPNRLVVLNEYQLNNGETSVAWMNFLDWREQSKSFEDLAAYRAIHLTLTGAGEPELLRAGQVSAAFFPLLGVKTILGRTFTKPEDTPESAATVVLSYNFWRNRLGGDPAVVGKMIALDGASYSAIGVLAPGFDYFNQKVDIYVPIGLSGKTPAWLDRVNHPGLLALARLKPGVSLATARSEIDTIMRRLEAEYPKSNSGERASVVPLYDQLYGDVKPAMFTLLAAVGLVLLIACANVANLMLARAASRQREFAVRAAIGASRGRVIRQLLTESVLLSSAGGLMGLLLASWMISPLLRIAPPEIPRLGDTQVNLWVFAFTLIVSVTTGIVFGLAPALQTSNLDLNRVLKESGHSTSGPSRDRVRAALFVSEVALASVLVIASGLLIRSLWKAQNVNPGFNADHLLALDVMLPHSAYKTDPQILNFFEQASKRIRNLPGVRSASAVFCPPTVGTCWTSVYLVEGRPVPAQDQLAESVFNVAQPDYFQTMGIPLIEGRPFQATDTAQTPPVIVINQSMARRWWPNESPLGKRIKQGFPQSKTPYREIVGVVGDVKQDGPDTPTTRGSILSGGAEHGQRNDHGGAHRGRSAIHGSDGGKRNSRARFQSPGCQGSTDDPIFFRSAGAAPLFNLAAGNFWSARFGAGRRGNLWRDGLFGGATDSRNRNSSGAGRATKRNPDAGGGPGIAFRFSRRGSGAVRRFCSDALDGEPAIRRHGH